MNKKYLKWTAYPAVALFVLALLGGIFYLFLPAILGILTGVPDACLNNTDSTGSPQAIQDAMSELCFTAQAFLGVLIMVVLIVGGLIGFLSVVLTTIDIFQSKNLSTGRKILWLAVIWLLAGFIASFVYYLVERKKD